jgi:hypothetical protein
MDDFIGELERAWPGAAKRITAQGPQVPVAYRMDGTQLKTLVTGIPHTPLPVGIRKTLDYFAQLQRHGRLSG